MDRLAHQLLSALCLTLCATPVNAAQAVAPRSGEWAYTACECVGSSPTTRRHFCKVLEDGEWAVPPIGGACVNQNVPSPWATEGLMIERVQRSDPTVAFTFWIEDASDAPFPDDACWSVLCGRPDPDFELGILSTQTAAFEPFEFRARRAREVTCGDAYRWDGQRCVLDANTVTLHKNNDACPAGPNGTDPVNSRTGHLIHRHTDYRGAGPHPLIFTRYYTNGEHVRSDAFGGNNWRHTYARRLLLVDTSNVTTVTAVRPNGDEYFFNHDSTTGAWLGDPDVRGRLVEIRGSDGQRSGWLYHNAADEREEYDASGTLTAVSNAAGFRHALHHDLDTDSGGDGDPATLDRVVHELSQRALELRYDDRRRLISMTAQPAGSVYRFDYGSAQSDNLVEVSYPDDGNPEDLSDNPTIQYHIDESGLTDANTLPGTLTAITDENGARFAQWTYIGNRVTRFEQAPAMVGNVNEVELSYDDSNGTTTISDALNQSRTFGFDIKHGRALVAQIDGGHCAACGNNLQRASYDANGFLLGRIDHNGNEQLFRHDDRGREVCRIEGISTSRPDDKDAYRRILTHWHAEFDLPTLRRVYALGAAIDRPLVCDDDPLSSAWVLTAEIETTYATPNDPGDAGGRIDEIIERSLPRAPAAPDRVTNFVYYGDEPGDALALAGLLKRVDGPRTDVVDITEYIYATTSDASHAIGDLLEIRNALGQTTLITAHDAHGRPLAMVDANGIPTVLTYHPRGWLTSRTVDGATTAFSYDAVGQLQRVTFATRDYLAFEYDLARRLTDIHQYGADDAHTAHLHYTLESRGNRVGIACGKTPAKRKRARAPASRAPSSAFTTSSINSQS